jgi:hypothetical protein
MLFSLMLCFTPAVTAALPLSAIVAAAFPILVALHVNAFVGALVFAHFLHSFLL